MSSAVPEKPRSGNAPRNLVANARTSSRPRHGPCNEYSKRISGEASSSMTAGLKSSPQNSEPASDDGLVVLDRHGVLSCSQLVRCTHCGTSACRRRSPAKREPISEQYQVAPTDLRQRIWVGRSAKIGMGGDVDLVALRIGQGPPLRCMVADQGAAGRKCGLHASLCFSVR